MKKQLILASLAIFLTSATLGYAYTGDFSDSKDFANWNKDAIKTMAIHNIITGYEDGRFGPNLSVTRGELAVILNRFSSQILEISLPSEQFGCTAVFTPNFTLYLRDAQGQPVLNASIDFDNQKNSMEEDFSRAGEGIYTSKAYAQGSFTLNINKEGYGSHHETVRIPKSFAPCTQTKEVRTVTLFKQS